jgi:hypothetical protein
MEKKLPENTENRKDTKVQNDIEHRVNTEVQNDIKRRKVQSVTEKRKVHADTKVQNGIEQFVNIKKSERPQASENILNSGGLLIGQKQIVSKQLLNVSGIYVCGR